MRSEDSQLFRAPIYWAHRAVYCATAQLSCYSRAYCIKVNGRSDLNNKQTCIVANLLVLRLNNYCCFHACSARFKKHQNQQRPGFRPGPIGELTALPQTSSWWEGLPTYFQEPHPASVLVPPPLLQF